MGEHICYKHEKILEDQQVVCIAHKGECIVLARGEDNFLFSYVLKSCQEQREDLCVRWFPVIP
jgi:hypothetical protein